MLKKVTTARTVLFTTKREAGQRTCLPEYVEKFLLLAGKSNSASHPATNTREHADGDDDLTPNTRVVQTCHPEVDNSRSRLWSQNSAWASGREDFSRRWCENWGPRH
ncbi:unnamed protein product [Calypogeia fissa]